MPLDKRVPVFAGSDQEINKPLAKGNLGKRTRKRLRKAVDRVERRQW